MKNNNKKTLKKLAILVIGSIIAAYGITLALYAGFGGATLAVLWQGLARTFHISIGTASFVVALGMILFALIYDKSQIHIGTVLYQIVYSTCVDLFANCHIYSTYKWINFLIMVTVQNPCLLQDDLSVPSKSSCQSFISADTVLPACANV